MLAALVLLVVAALPNVTGARGRERARRDRDPDRRGAERERDPARGREAPRSTPRVRTAPLPALPPGAFRYRQLDIGQGDAALLESGDGPAALVDTGPDPRAETLLRAVRGVGRRLAWVLVTHGHGDHHGGLEGVLAIGLPERLIVPAAPVEGAEWARTLAFVRGTGADVVEASRGTKLTFAANVNVEVLAPSSPPIERSRSDVNANGIVVRVDHMHADRTHRFLLTGDAELPTEARLLERPEELRADVLKVAHHGSTFSSSLRFLEAVAPTYAVISAAEGNDYGHPHGAALERLLGVGARILRTDLHGEIVATSADGTLALSVNAEPAPGAEAVAPHGDSRNLPRRHRPRRGADAAPRAP